MRARPAAALPPRGGLQVPQSRGVRRGNVHDDIVGKRAEGRDQGRIVALGIGRGSGLQRPLATAIIFGLAIGAPLVVTMLPSLVLVFTELPKRWRKPTATQESLAVPT